MITPTETPSAPVQRVPIVEMRNIQVAFGGVRAVAGVTIDLHPGEVVGVVGGNGAGKTTLMRTLSGARPPDAGQILVNGQPVAAKNVPADDKEHDLSFNIQIDRSSWVALRHFPQMHTNPVTVIVDDKPIRASKKSALWCIGTIEQLWRERGDPAKMPLSPIDAQFAPKRRAVIAAHEIQEAFQTFQRAIEAYRKIVAECPEGS